MITKNAPPSSTSPFRNFKGTVFYTSVALYTFDNKPFHHRGAPRAEEPTSFITCLAARYEEEVTASATLLSITEQVKDTHHLKLLCSSGTWAGALRFLLVLRYILVIFLFVSQY